MSELERVLARLGLSQYVEAFISEGFETWDTVLDITEADLDALGVKRGHRRKIQREIASARGLSAEHSLHPSAQPTPSEDRSTEGEDAQSSNQGESARPPVGSSGKRKYRRHPKRDDNAPERPPSAYVIFSNKIRESLKGQNLSFTDIAKLVGEKWQDLSPEEKGPYESQAASAKEKYKLEMTEYKKTDSYKEYMQYLNDFNSRRTIPRTDGKRPKLEGAQQQSGHMAMIDSPTSQQSAPSASTMPIGRARGESIGSAGGYSGSSGQTSPVLHPPSSFPSVIHPGASQIPSSGLGHRDITMNVTSRPAVPGSTGYDYKEDTERSPTYQHLPRLNFMEQQSDRRGHINLPPINAESLGSEGRQTPSMESRRSHNAASTLHREGSSAFSVSSNSTFASGSVGSPPLGDSSRVPEGLAFGRGLPMPSSMSSRYDAASPRSNELPRPLHAPLVAHGTYGTHQTSRSPPVGHHSSVPTTSAQPSEYPHHFRTHAHSSPDDRASIKRDARTSTLQSAARDASPFSVLLSAGEKIAARDAERSP
ncbi:MAG: hypothetical protein M1833_005847 [Piccolia ochrophora]|nr:MAG: hypothetical protein M1833_005847 [Piccolia ochrophora]